jgi:hypothetical protein
VKELQGVGGGFLFPGFEQFFLLLWKMKTAIFHWQLFFQDFFRFGFRQHDKDALQLPSDPKDR